VNRAAVHGLIQRRGNRIAWMHAIAPDPSTIDSLTLGPKGSIGAPGSDAGPFGESYMDPVNVKAYLSNKAAAATFQAYGIVEVGDLQLDFAVPFAPEPGIEPLPEALEQAYNAGDFCILGQRSDDYDDAKTVVFDRFTILGKTYVAKARPVPIVDQDVLIAWRLLVGVISSGI